MDFYTLDKQQVLRRFHEEPIYVRIVHIGILQLLFLLLPLIDILLTSI